MLELFRELITKINEGSSMVERSSNRNVVVVSSKEPVKVKVKVRANGKVRQVKEASKERETKEMRLWKESQEEGRMRQERKEELFGNYSMIMEYRVVEEEAEEEVKEAD